MIDFIKKNKKKIALIALVLVVLIGLTFGYFRATGVNVTTLLSANSGATPQLVFNDGSPVSLTFGQSDFASGSGNKTATGTASATLYTNSSADGASMTYDVYVRLNSNFVYSNGTTPEVVLTITDPAGTILTSEYGIIAEWEDNVNSFQYNSSLGGYDVTEASNGLYSIGSYSISSSSANQTVTQNWSVKVTLRNLSTNQKINEGKSFSAQVILVKHGGLASPVIGLDSTLYNFMATHEYVSSYVGQAFNDTVTETDLMPFGWLPVYLNDSTGSNYSAILESNNVLFAGFCWQMIRTTTDGGVKLIYNGEPSNGTCASTRGNHTGIVGSDGTTKDLSGGLVVYGEGFTYSGTTFTLTDTVTKTWSASTYKDLIGKYTCGTTSSSCTTLYYVGPSSNSTYGYNASAYVASYTIGSTKYAQVGTSAFNVGHISLASAGYMFNYFNRYTANSAPTSSAIMGNDVKYANGKYYLKNTSTTMDSTHHYTCNSTTATSCESVRYYYNSSMYITLSDGKNITETVNAMLYDDNVNKYDSTMKKYLENWYKLNLVDYSSFLEDVVWCNDRTMTNAATNGWYPNGGGANTHMYFRGWNNKTDLSCPLETDQFSMANPKAKIKYPVGLLTYTESYLLGNDTLRNIGIRYWLFSPESFNNLGTFGRYVDVGGSNTSHSVSYVRGVRPSIVLAPGVVVSEGNGSTSTPYRILGDNYSY